MLHGSVKVGDAEILALCDIAGNFPTGLREAFPDVPEAEWPEFRERYPDAFGGDDVWLAHDHCFLVRSPGATILVDTGVGPLNLPRYQYTAGLVPALEQAGVGADEIDAVVFTHLHFDHVGWNIDGGEPRFAKARHLVHRADRDTFETGGDPLSNAAFHQSVKPLEAAGMLELIDGTLELAQGIEVVPTPGHTLGHVAVTVSSGDERAVLSGDVVNHPAQLADPTWREIADMDLDAAAASRRELFGEDGGSTVFAPAHFPEPFGHVSTERGRYVWTPAQ